MQLDELYRQVIMDHYQNPRNQGQLEQDALTVDMRNPSCGDEIRLQLLVDHGVVRDVRFRGTGCSISMASASMMSVAVKGLPVEKALVLIDDFRHLMKGEDVEAEELGDLETLQGVAKFPARIKCALLAWNALERGIRPEDT